ncbi:hypothetical protein E2C01_045379 [Portunus trituberculatus]|uniref:Uncharacterized protein n=1 Tax=Portunus trituberculatus TaxID=210409 RepID=A0A5B7FY69_PORTR|nr:hypothetical protein [Portunus trituberculatus]
MDLHLPSKGSPNQQRRVPQKNSQSRKLLWEALVEGNPPPYSDLKMTSRGPELRTPSQSIPAWTPNHPTEDDPSWAIPPAGGSSGLLNAKTGIFKELWELMEPGRSFPESGLQAMKKVLEDDIVYASGSLNLEIRASQIGRHQFYVSSDTFLPQLYGIACFPGAPFKDKFSIM